MAENKKINKRESQKQDFSNLAEEIFLWSKEELFPKDVSADAAYILQAHRQRLRQKGLEMEYAMTSQDFFLENKTEKVSLLRWKCKGNMEFTMDSGRQKEISGQYHLYAFAKWQGRKYMIEQLYFKKAYETDRDKLLRKTLRFFGIGAVIGFLVALYQILILNSMEYTGLLVDPVVGALFGYAVYALFQLGKLVIKGIREMPLIRKSGQTAMEITSVMRLLNQEFSFPVFEAQIVNLLQRVIYAADISEIDQYEPEARERQLEDIIQCIYEGNMIFRGYHSEEKKCILNLDLYMLDVYYKKSRIWSQRDVYHMTVYRDFGQSKEKAKKWIIQAIWRDKK